MASIIAQERRNVGQLIYDEIERFRFSSSTAAPIPYPQLVSFFLQKHKIWYLDLDEPVCRISSFSKTQLNRMHIEVPDEGFKKEKVQKRMKKAEPPRKEHMDEVQSTYRSESSALSFMGSAIQAFIEEGFRKLAETLKDREDKQSKTLVETMDSYFLQFSQIKSQTMKEVVNLRGDVNYLRDIVLAHISSQIPSPSGFPSSESSPKSQNSPVSSDHLQSNYSLTLSPVKPIYVAPPLSFPIHPNSSFLFSPLNPTSSQTLPTTPVSSTPLLHLSPPQIDPPSLETTPVLQLTSDTQPPIPFSESTPVIPFSPESPTDFHFLFHPDTAPTLQLFPDDPTLSANDKKGEKQDELSRDSVEKQDDIVLQDDVPKVPDGEKDD